MVIVAFGDDKPIAMFHGVDSSCIIPGAQALYPNTKYVQRKEKRAYFLSWELEDRRKIKITTLLLYV